MKPTQQEIIDVAREAGIVFDERAMPYYERLVHLALERFGAGGGEPVAYVEHHKAGDNLVWDNPGGKYSPLFTHPSPTELRAEYLRGLDDAKKVCLEQEELRDHTPLDCAEAIEALKDKQ